MQNLVTVRLMCLYMFMHKVTWEVYILIHFLFCRVKAAILKKEEIVTQLRQQYEAAVKRADHLEGLLDQQRKQLLKIGKK